MSEISGESNTGGEKPFSTRMRITWRIFFVAIAAIPPLVMAFFWIQSRSVAHVWHSPLPAKKGHVSVFTLDGCFRMIVDSGHGLSIDGNNIERGCSVVPSTPKTWPWGYFKIDIDRVGSADGVFMSLPFWLLEVLWIGGVIVIAMLMRRRRKQMTGKSG